VVLTLVVAQADYFYHYAFQLYEGSIFMIKDVVGSKNYSVWLGMLKRLVPSGRTHRLSVVAASMLQLAYELAKEREESNAKARQLSSIFECAREHDEENGMEPLLKITEQLFKDAGVGFKRVNRKGQRYSIAEEAVYQFLNWDAMPWEG
jgi:hypothetical protein